MSKKPKSKDEYRQRLAEAFAQVLEEDGLEWKQEWTSAGASAAPYNAITKAKYRGSNAFYLAILSLVQGYNDPRWVTMVQIMDKKGKYHAGQKWHLKAGSEAVWVEYWYPYDLENKRAITWPQYREALLKDGRHEEEFRLSTNYYAVYNASQVEGMPPLELTATQNREVEPDALIALLSRNMGVPVLNDGGGQAFYRPGEDAVHLPLPEVFESSYAYNATALHELAHATGHPSRLNRDQSGGFGTEGYAYEELVAEMTSCFMGAGLTAQASQRHIENHKAYVQNWINRIRDKPETLIRAIKDAQGAADYMDFKAELITQQEYEQKRQPVTAASAISQQTRQDMASEQVLRREEAPREEPEISFIPYSELTKAQKSMVEDLAPIVRVRAAQRGYALDRLVADPSSSVRAAVAKQGHGLDRLIEDPDPGVRVAVAEQGYGLDRLVDDPEWLVRTSVAYQGYGLDRLIDDPAWVVRVAVADQGYGLDRLVDDPNKTVAEAAREKLAELAAGREEIQAQAVEGDVVLAEQREPEISFIPFSELTEDQKSMVEDPDPLDRAAAAGQGYGLDRLIDDPEQNVREAVADQGYGLDRLIDDPSSYVRAAVAYQNYGLDRLIDDPSWIVREAVAHQGYGLDRLVEDPNRNVRAVVAYQGYGLDRLIDDPDLIVRRTVAMQGYGLDRLANDPNEMVAEAAQKKLAELAAGQEEIRGKASKLSFIPYSELTEDQKSMVENLNQSVRVRAAQQGYALDLLVADPSSSVRAAVAYQGYGLDRLIHDPESGVRTFVADQGYGLDRLINDPNPLVRTAVAKQRYGLDRLIDDPNPLVRAAVAKQGYGLDRLIDDPAWVVRAVVAKQGHGLDRLVDDPNKTVAEAAREKLAELAAGREEIQAQARESGAVQLHGFVHDDVAFYADVTVDGQARRPMMRDQGGQLYFMVRSGQETIRYELGPKQSEAYRQYELSVQRRSSMEISIYQINLRRGARVAFLGMESLEQRGSAEIRSEIYDCVYSGQVPCKDLEDVFALFNLRHPEGYTGRSLSVSDVVQVRSGGEDVKPGFYFCDSVDFREVAFDPSKAMAQREMEIPNRAEHEIER